MAISKDLDSAGSVRQRIQDKVGTKITLQRHMPPGTNTIDLKDYKSKYGLIDQFGNAVEPLYGPTMTILEGTESLEVMPFVAAQYSSMKRKFEELSSKNGSMYGFLQPVRASSRLDREYDIYLSDLIGTFMSESYAAKKNKIYNFGQFCEEFIKFIIKTRINRVNGGMPVTKTLFTASNHVKINASGLVIEFKDSEFNDASGSVFPWMKDKNFSLYCDAATKSGFMVDEEYPFRIVADLSSKKMQAAAEYYGAKTYLPGTAADIFTTFYKKTSLYDYIIIKNKLIKAYRFFSAKREVTRVIPCRGTTKKILEPREQLTVEELIFPPVPGIEPPSFEEVFGPNVTESDISNSVKYGLHSKKYNILFFIELYVRIRYYEIQYIAKYLTLSDLGAIVREAKKRALRGNPNSAFNYINEKFKSYRMLVH